MPRTAPAHVAAHGTPPDPACVLADPARLAALDASGALAPDTRDAMDRLARLVARVLRAPMAIVSLVGADGQWIAGAAGLPEPLATERRVPLSHSFCQYVVTGGAPLVIPDTHAHPAWAANAATRDFGIVAYIGVPLVTPDGHVLGSVCGVDLQRRVWDEADVGALLDLSAAVSTELQLRAEVVERRTTVVALHRSEARFRSLNRSSPVGVFESDLDGQVTYVNPRILTIWEATEPELLGRGWANRVHPDDAPALLDGWTAALAGAAEFAHEYRVVLPGGQTRWVRGQSAPLRDDAGAAIGSVGTVEDIHERRALETALVRRAREDSLTGLANRAVFRERVDRAVTRTRAAAATRRTVTVLFVDLDDFKAVNDALGHAVGDRLLGEVAARLLRATRGCDTVARLGGDEFGVLLEHVADAEDGARVAERVGASLATPFALDGRDVRVTASIGIASDAVGGCEGSLGASLGECADDETPGEAADRLLRHADVAMYRAKARGKACHVTFSPAMQREVIDRLELGMDLDRAVADQALTLVFQPIVDLADGRVAGFEALARWTHPVRGFVSPALFIPLAEQTGAILALGQWVLYRACAAAARWGSGLADAGAPAVTVNVSGRQLQDPALPSVVAGALHASGLAPERLTLEITEGVLMEDTESTLERLHALRALGVRLAVDDFGTGYSSLAYLHRFPIDVLKLDKTFVDGVARGGRDAVLARTIVTLGATMQLRTVAEGIEHAGQRDALREMGCPLGQGYLFSRPVPEGDVAALLARDRLA